MEGTVYAYCRKISASKIAMKIVSYYHGNLIYRSKSLL